MMLAKVNVKPISKHFAIAQVVSNGWEYNVFLVILKIPEDVLIVIFSMIQN